MLNRLDSRLRLAYWQDDFTVLNVRQVYVKPLNTSVTELLLYCRGRHTLGYLTRSREPLDGLPKPGDKISATLRITRPDRWRLFVQLIQKV
jgi:hypothetical protein